MEATRSSEILVHSGSPRRHIPEDSILHSHTVKTSNLAWFTVYLHSHLTSMECVLFNNNTQNKISSDTSVCNKNVRKDLCITDFFVNLHNAHHGHELIQDYFYHSFTGCNGKTSSFMLLCTINIARLYLLLVDLHR
jgi:hypothetical protein